MADLNVLVIEDTKRWGGIFESLLRKIDPNSNIILASHKAAARTYFENELFDLIILDLRLPENSSAKKGGITNLDLLKEIRKEGARNEYCATIITTAFGRIPLVNSALGEYGVSDFFEKTVKKGGFVKEEFIRACKRAILQARLKQLEIREEKRREITIHVSDDLVLGCEVEGPLSGRSTYFAKRPDVLPLSELTRRGENLDIYLSTKKGIENWRPEVKAIGEEIFRVVFSDSGCLEKLHFAQDKGPVQDLWIRFNGTPATIGVPFELIYDSHYLARNSVFYRSLSNYPVIEKKPFHFFISDQVRSGNPLKILIAASNSDNRIPEVDDEAVLIKHRVETSLNHLGIKSAVDISLTDIGSYENVSRRLHSGGYHIFHYCGHGDFDSSQPEYSGIWLLDADGNPKKLEAYKLNLLVQNSNLQLVFLNCCLGASMKETVGKGDFYGIYDALAKAGVPTVLGYRWTVRNESAQVFAKVFYEELWRSFSPAEAVQSAKRQIILSNGIEDETWASPVLLMQHS